MAPLPKTKFAFPTPLPQFIINAKSKQKTGFIQISRYLPTPFSKVVKMMFVKMCFFLENDYYFDIQNKI